LVKLTGNGENYIVRNLVICTANKIFSGNKIIEMGGAYSVYGERRGVYRVLVGKREGKTTWETQA
jgi:hypothetical protein